MRPKKSKIKVRVLKRNSPGRKAVLAMPKLGFTFGLKKFFALFMFFSLLTYSFGYNITKAKFSDRLTSSGSSWTASTLLFSLTPSPNANFAPNVTPTTNATSTITIAKTGALAFQYRLKTANASGALCSSLNLAASLGGSQQYNGALSVPSINLSNATTTTGAWNFIASFNTPNPPSSLFGATCGFDLTYSAWQVGIAENSGGFTDVLTVHNTVTAGTWDPCLTTDTYSTQQIGASFGTTDHNIIINGPNGELKSPTSGTSNGTISIITNCDVTINGGKITAIKGDGTAGTMMIVARNLSINSGSAVSSDSTSGSGGMVTMTIQGNLTQATTGVISANATAGNNNGGKIGIKVAGTASYSGTVSANGTKNDVGGKQVALWSEGATTISGTISANSVSGTGSGVGGTVDITSRSLLTVSSSGKISVTGHNSNGQMFAAYVTKNFVSGSTFNGSPYNSALINEATIALNNVVLNEINANPSSGQQWVELYNKATTTASVGNWQISSFDLTNSSARGTVSLSATSTIPANGTLVVFLGTTPASQTPVLNVTGGDRVRLLDNSSPTRLLQDGFSYVIDIVANHSISRMPDGTGAWVDPDPTPGELNGPINFDKLRAELLAEALLEMDTPQTATTTDPNLPATSTDTTIITPDATTSPTTIISGSLDVAAPADQLATTTDQSATGTPPVIIDASSTTPSILDATSTPASDSSTPTSLITPPVDGTSMPPSDAATTADTTASSTPVSQPIITTDPTPAPVPTDPAPASTTSTGTATNPAPVTDSTPPAATDQTIAGQTPAILPQATDVSAPVVTPTEGGGNE